MVKKRGSWISNFKSNTDNDSRTDGNSSVSFLSKTGSSKTAKGRRLRKQDRLHHPLIARDDISDSKSESVSSEDEGCRRLPVPTKGRRLRIGNGHSTVERSEVDLLKSECDSSRGEPGLDSHEATDETKVNILVIEETDQPAIPDSIPSEDFILSYGLSKVGWSNKRQCHVKMDENIKRFKSQFGPHPRTVRALFNGVKEEFPKATIEYLLLALNWLKLYETEYVLNGRWEKCNDHIRAKTKEYVKMIQSLKGKKIIFGGFDSSEINWITVDTVNFRVQECRLNPSRDYFDHKSSGCGLKYEFACALRRPAIVWARGPVPAGKIHDGTMFRGGRKGDKELDQEALHQKLPAGKKAIGDSGYEGMQDKVTVTRDGQSKELKQFLGRAKNRQESMHTRLKSYGALGGCFRHGTTTKNKMQLHQMCVEAVCVIVQFDLENGNPLFDL